MYNYHKFQDQDLHLTTANQIVELDDNELDNIAGGEGGESSWRRVERAGRLIGRIDNFRERGGFRGLKDKFNKGRNSV